MVLGHHVSAAAAALIVAAVGCRHSKQPERPAKVPVSAVWAGGPDGGSWIECSHDDAGENYACTVYSDSTGDIEAKGRYSFHGSRSSPPALLRFSGFDGETILLTDGRLEPLRAK